MTALPHSLHPATAVSSDDWWSPLGEHDARGVLETYGAIAGAKSRWGATWVVCPKDDPFAMCLAFEVRGAARGSLIRIRAMESGFAGDFARAVQASITIYAALFVLYWASSHPLVGLVRPLTAVGLGWAIFMALFSAMRSLIAFAQRRDEALREAQRKLRLALFVQRPS